MKDALIKMKSRLLKLRWGSILPFWGTVVIFAHIWFQQAFRKVQSHINILGYGFLSFLIFLSYGIIFTLICKLINQFIDITDFFNNIGVYIIIFSGGYIMNFSSLLVLHYKFVPQIDRAIAEIDET